MAIQVKPVPRQRKPEAKTLSYEAFVQEGDRLYRRHLDARECGNMLGDCLNQYSRALEQVPDSAEVLCRMAKVFLRQGNYNRAEKCAQKALQLVQAGKIDRRARRHVCRECCYILGFIHAQNGNLSAAYVAYLTAVKTGGFATCRARLGLFQACKDLAQKEPKFHRAALYTLQAVYALMTMILTFPFEQERMTLSYMMHAVPKIIGAWFTEEFAGTEKALPKYLAIHRQYPGIGAVGIVIGDIYREKGQPEKALYWFERVLSKHPASLDAHYHMAKLLEQREDYQGMVDVYERLTHLRSGDPHIYCNLANAYYYNQAYKEALLNYETALHLGADGHWLAMVAQSIGNIQADYFENYDAALAYFEMAKTLDPSEIENYIQLGLLYFQKEDFINAELVYRKALAIAPKNPKLYSNIGYLRWMEGDIDHAVNYYEKAIKIDDSYEIPLNNLGVIYLDTLGKVHRAMELFQQAIDINEDYALAYYNLGRAHSFLNHRLEAARCFRIAQDLNRFSQDLDNEELDERINNLFDTCEMEPRD